jgi:tetratricopeptide (TPR) repeat protein
MNLGDVHQELGHHDEAVKHLEEALAIARECGDRGVETRVLNSFGGLALARGAPFEAVGHYQAALVLAVETECRAEQALAHRGLGDAHSGDDARRHWERALALYNEMSLPEAAQLQARGYEARHKGQPEPPT